MKIWGTRISTVSKRAKAEDFKIKNTIKARTNKPKYHEASREMIREAKDFAEYCEIALNSEKRRHERNPYA